MNAGIIWFFIGSSGAQVPNVASFVISEAPIQLVITEVPV